MRETLTAIAEIDLAGPILVGLAAGLLLGLIHFGSLWWNARLYAGGGWARALCLHLLRFCLLLAVLWLGSEHRSCSPGHLGCSWRVASCCVSSGGRRDQLSADA